MGGAEAWSRARCGLGAGLTQQDVIIAVVVGAVLGTGRQGEEVSAQLQCLLRPGSAPGAALRHRLELHEGCRGGAKKKGADSGLHSPAPCFPNRPRPSFAPSRPCPHLQALPPACHLKTPPYPAHWDTPRFQLCPFDKVPPPILSPHRPWLLH